jgi:hypothetical protein
MVFFQYFTSLAIVIPFIFGIRNLKRLSDNLARPFLLYLLILTLLELICLYQSVNYKNNHLVYNCIDLITIIFFTLIFHQNKQTYLKYVSLLITIITIVNTYVNNPFIFKQTNYLLIYSFIGIVSTYILYKSTKSDSTIFFNSFKFWFYSGFILSSLSTLTMYIFFDRIIYLNQNDILVKYYSFLNFVITFLQYTSFSVSLSCKN